MLAVAPPPELLEPPPLELPPLELPPLDPPMLKVVFTTGQIPALVQALK
jgi:hypothetical protein